MISLVVMTTVLLVLHNIGRKIVIQSIVGCFVNYSEYVIVYYCDTRFTFSQTIVFSSVA